MSNSDSGLPSLRDILARAHVRLIMFAVLLATASLVLSGGLVIRNYAQRNLELVARTVAYTVEPAVLFGDGEAIRQGIVSVAAGRGIERVEVRDPAGRVLAEWNSPQTGAISAISRAVNPVFWPEPAVDRIQRGPDRIGDVRIYGNSEGILRYGLAGVIIALTCLGLTVIATRILAQRLQSEVVRPLEHVAAVAHAVRQDRAFERRVPASGIAEIDRFGRDFNALLAELQGWHAGLTSENQELVWRANHDGLTGLGNRQMFEASMAVGIAQAQREQKSLAIIYLDIDRFKSINDQHGHASGDAALIAVGERLRAAIRQHDQAFRLGGDEFAVLLAPVSGPVDACGVVERIRQEMDRPFRLPSGVHIATRLSAGLAVFPEDGENAEDILRKADARMYRDKLRDQGSGVRANA